MFVLPEGWVLAHIVVGALYMYVSQYVPAFSSSGVLSRPVFHPACAVIASVSPSLLRIKPPWSPYNARISCVSSPSWGLYNDITITVAGPVSANRLARICTPSVMGPAFPVM